MDPYLLDGGIPVGGRQLRWLLTLYLKRAGTLTVAELAEALRADGYVVDGRVSKVISDSLRWEIRWRRVVRVRRGVYRFGRIPRSTEYRMRKGIGAMRAWCHRRRQVLLDAAAGLPPASDPWADGDPPPLKRVPCWEFYWQWIPGLSDRV